MTYHTGFSYSTFVEKHRLLNSHKSLSSLESRKIPCKLTTIAVPSSGSRVSETMMSSITAHLPSQHNNEGKETDLEERSLEESVKCIIKYIAVRLQLNLSRFVFHSCRNSFLYQ